MDNPLSPFKKLNWKTNGRLFGFGTSPECDWKIIFISTIILVALVGVLSVYIFMKIDRGEIFVVEKSDEPSEKSLDVSLLKETVLYYKNKALEFKRIKSLVVPSTDSSL